MYFSAALQLVAVPSVYCVTVMSYDPCVYPVNSISPVISTLLPAPGMAHLVPSPKRPHSSVCAADRARICPPRVGGGGGGGGAARRTEADTAMCTRVSMAVAWG